MHTTTSVMTTFSLSMNSRVPRMVTRFVNNIVYAGVGLVGAVYAVRGGITIGQLSVFLSYANQYTKPFNEISGVVTELQNALACAARVPRREARVTSRMSVPDTLMEPPFTS